MVKTFFISDTHFYHKKIVKFNCPRTGLKLRPWDNVEDMNSAIVENWNRVVSDQDIVYHVGDVLLGNKENLVILNSLKGRKRLIMGNHDTATALVYSNFFEKVMASKIVSGLLVTHYPVKNDYYHKYLANVHGHVHSCSLEDDFYYNVSVEAINYTPVSLDTILLTVNNSKTKS